MSRLNVAVKGLVDKGTRLQVHILPEDQRPNRKSNLNHNQEEQTGAELEEKRDWIIVRIVLFKDLSSDLPMR